MLVRGLAQLAVPAGEVNTVRPGGNQRSCKMKAVVGTQPMVDRDQLCAAKGFSGHREDVDLGPSFLQVPEANPELCSGYATAFADSRQRGCRLDAGKNAGRNGAGMPKGVACDIAIGLIDEELDQGAGIEIEAQRRPSETYSAAVLPGPRSLIGFLGRVREPFPGLTAPCAISSAIRGDLAVETILATGFPRRVTVTGSPASTRSMTLLSSFFSSRMPTLALM